MNHRLSRLALLAGPGAMLMWIVTVILVDSDEARALGDAESASAAELAEYLRASAMTLYAGTVLWGIGSVLFLVFLAALHARLAAAHSMFAVLAFGSGVAAVVTMFGFFGMRLGAVSALDSDPARISPDGAQALYAGMDGFFVMTWFALASLFLAVGLAGIRGQLIPRWLGWSSVALAAGSTTPWTGWAAELFLPPWVVAVCLVLLRVDADRADFAQRGAEDVSAGTGRAGARRGRERP